MNVPATTDMIKQPLYSGFDIFYSHIKTKENNTIWTKCGQDVSQRRPTAA